MIGLNQSCANVHNFKWVILIEYEQIWACGTIVSAH